MQPPALEHCIMAELSAMRCELAAMRALLQALVSRDDDRKGTARAIITERFCAAVVASFGGGQEFTSADLVEWIALAPALRADLHSAARALCTTDGVPTPHQLGIALGKAAQQPMRAYRVECTKDVSPKVWRVLELSGVSPNSPAGG
jgi:hypothetical protein